jgi:hypothetical protein
MPRFACCGWILHKPTELAPRRRLLIAEITFTNENEFPVHGVIIACDFCDPPHLYLGRRGNLIPRIPPPGRTTIGEIEFTMLKKRLLDWREVKGAGIECNARQQHSELKVMEVRRLPHNVFAGQVIAALF